MEKLSAVDNLESMFNSIGFDLPDNIKRDIAFDLLHNQYINKHYSFLLDLKSKKILCHAFNIYFKSASFPFSIHAEIQTLVKYYKSKTVNKNKKALLVAKLSRTGIVGNSKCCLNCMRFIRNNLANVNLKKIYYSTKGTQLVELSKRGLVDEHFKISKGFMYRSSGVDATAEY